MILGILLFVGHLIGAIILGVLTVYLAHILLIRKSLEDPTQNTQIGTFSLGLGTIIGVCLEGVVLILGLILLCFAPGTAVIGGIIGMCFGAFVSFAAPDKCRIYCELCVLCEREAPEYTGWTKNMKIFGGTPVEKPPKDPNKVKPVKDPAVKPEKPPKDPVVKPVKDPVVKPAKDTTTTPEKPLKVKQTKKRKPDWWYTKRGKPIPPV